MKAKNQSQSKKTLSSKIISVFLLLMMINYLSNAQPQNPVWSQPPYLINFTSTAPTATQPYPSTLISDYAHNVAVDGNGTILFYIVDGTIYDASGNIIDHIYWNANNDILTGTTEYLIVPVPGNCNEYYLIAGVRTSTSTQGELPEPFYATYDITLGLISNPATQLSNYSNELHAGVLHLAVSPLRAATNDRLLFVASSSEIFVYTITSSGINYVNDIFDYETYGSPENSDMRSEMELFSKTDGTYVLAVPSKIVGVSSVDSRIFLVHLDHAGTVTTWQSINFASAAGYPFNQPKGLEFSPSGEYLYVTNTVPPYMQYIDVNGSIPALHTFTQAAATASDFKYSQIELAYDKKIYLPAGIRMASIDSPDDPVTTSFTNAVPTLNNFSTPLITVSLGGGITGTGRDIVLMPDQIDGESYDLLTGNTNTLAIMSTNNSVCSGSTSDLTATLGFSGYLWNTSATTSSVNVSTPGIYTVTVTSSCGQTASASYTVYYCCHDFNYDFNNDYPGYIVSTNTTFTVNGNYDVNDNILVTGGGTVIFNNCTFDIAVGKTITIDPNTTLHITNNSRLYACGDMWAGIRFVNSSSKLIIDQNSEIEDAENAIYFDAGNGNGATIQLDNALFDNNYIAINLNGGDYSGSYIQNNTRFKCSSGYNLKNPHGLNRTLHQIQLTNMNNSTNAGIDIGNLSGSYNSFSDADVGIYSDNFSVSVNNNEFTTFTNNTVTGDFGYGIYIQKLQGGRHAYIGSVQQPNSFIDNSIGVFVTQSETKAAIEIIGNNEFYNCGEGVYLTNNIFNISHHSNGLYGLVVTDNIMDDMYDGINAVGNDFSLLYIERNHINTFNTTLNPDAGISVSNIAPGNGGFTLIDNNVIGSNGRLGIYLSALNSVPDVHENRVRMNQSTNGLLKGAFYGIRADKTFQGTFQCNEVDENAGTQNRKFGFSFYDCLKNTIQCNTTTGNTVGMQVGMQYVGNCVSNTIRANENNKCRNGFIIGDVGGPVPTMIDNLTNYYNPVTTQQEVPGNTWQPGTNAWDTYNYYQPSVPLLETHNPSPLPDWPTNNGAVGGVPINPTQQPLIPLFNCVANGIICNIPLLPDGGDHGGSFSMQFAQQVALSTLPGMSADDVTAWKARKILYQDLRKDTVMMDSSAILGDFYDSLTTENIGYLTDVSDLISQANDTTVSADSVQLASTVGAAQVINDDITSSFLPEFNEKVINEIYLNMIGQKRFELTSTELSDAMMVANQCIYGGGPAVIIARNVVHTQNPFVQFDDDDLCDNSVYRTSGAGGKNNTSAASTVFVFPNPAKDNLTFAFDKTNQEIKLFIKDIAGRVIEQKTIPSNSFSYKINLSKYPSGSFFYELKEKNITGRFEIIK